MSLPGSLASKNNNCATIPYWNGSPYGGADARSKRQGDVHCWDETVMNAEMSVRTDTRSYDRIKAKFIAEYGYIGTCAKSSINKYLDGAPFDDTDLIWQLHTNTFEKETVRAGIDRHYADEKSLTMDEYLDYAGKCQGLMLSYSLETFRADPHISGGLFWMYNDCYGETGWTIIDYYLTRKASEKGVKP